MLATGPRLPPYIGENIYKPGTGVRGLAVRALSFVQAKKGLNTSLGYPSVTGFQRSLIRPHVGMHPHGVLVLALCAICASTIVPAILWLVRKRRRWSRGPVIPTSANGSMSAFLTLDPISGKGCSDRATTTRYQPGENVC